MYVDIHVYMCMLYVYICVRVGMRICTCNAQVMRAYFQNLRTYPGDSVACCNWQIALQQSSSVSDVCDPTKCRLMLLLAFCDATSALHVSPGKFVYLAVKYHTVFCYVMAVTAGSQ